LQRFTNRRLKLVDGARGDPPQDRLIFER
jgi:hypothetical protein